MEKGCNCASYVCDCYKPIKETQKEGYLISLLETALITDNKAHSEGCIKSAIIELRSRK
jgi:hypothetical protein